MTIIKRCELCLKYTDCSLYDEVCQNLEFVKNFLDITQSNQIAQYCKEYKMKKKNLKDQKKELRQIKKNTSCVLWYLKRDINQLLRQKTRKDTTFINSINKTLDKLADELSFWVLDENTILQYKKDLRDISLYSLGISIQFDKYNYKRKKKEFQDYLPLKTCNFIPLGFIFKETKKGSE